MNLSPVFAETAIMDIIAIASTSAAIGPNSGTITVPIISILVSLAWNGMLRALVLMSFVSVNCTGAPLTMTMNLSSGKLLGFILTPVIISSAVKLACTLASIKVLGRSTVMDPSDVAAIVISNASLSAKISMLLTVPPLMVYGTL